MKAVLTKAAPAPIGPYSQAIDCGDIVFCSGAIPLDPVSGEIVPGGVAEQTKQVMANVDAVLRAANCTFANVVKTTIYLIDMSEFAAVNAVYGEAFAAATPPARSTVAVAALPRGSRVEIEVIARRG